jgi:hypothetical protein
MKSRMSAGLIGASMVVLTTAAGIQAAERVSGTQFTAQLKADIARWGKVIRDAGISAQ